MPAPTPRALLMGGACVGALAIAGWALLRPLLLPMEPDPATRRRPVSAPPAPRTAPAAPAQLPRSASGPTAPATPAAPRLPPDEAQARALLDRALALRAARDWAGLAALRRQSAPEGAPTRAALLALVRSGLPPDRLALATDLLLAGELVAADRAALAAALRAALDSNLGVDERAEVLRALGRLGDPATDTLLLTELRGSPAPATRRAAALALAERPPADVAPALLDLVRRDPAGRAGLYAAYALVQSARRAQDDAPLASLRELRPALERNLLDAGDVELVPDALATLAALDGTDTDAVLLAILRDRPDAALRSRAAGILGESGAAESLEALQSLATRETDPAVRAALEDAARALAARARHD